MVANESATGSLDNIGQMDHSTTQEYWMVGPPGTGKTKNTRDQVRRAARKFGANAVSVTSFSRAAAAELATCELPISPDNLGTLHSFCFRALDRPLIAEANVKEWNHSYPHLAITPVRGHDRLDGEEALEDDAGNAKSAGDPLLRDLNRYRGLMVEPHLWPTNIRGFERKWAGYKREKGLLDFCDLIDICLTEVASAPGNPSVIFVDESISESQRFA